VLLVTDPQKTSVSPQQTPTSPPRAFLCLSFHCRSSSGLETRSPPCPHPLHLCSPGFVFGSGRLECKHKIHSFPSIPSLHIIFTAYGNLQADPNTNQHPQLYCPHLCFSESTSLRERSHAAYSWLCSRGLGHTGDISSSQLNWRESSGGLQR